jgi:hypothetical protein
MTTPEAYAMSMNAVDTYDKNHKLTLDQYRNDFFCAVLSLLFA